MPNIPNLLDLSGKTALVTGASGGLGKHFGKALAVDMDVTSRESVIAALEKVARQIGPLDILVNNAGVSGTKRPLDYTDEDWDWVVGTNLKGAWVAAQWSRRSAPAASSISPPY